MAVKKSKVEAIKEITEKILDLLYINGTVETDVSTDETVHVRIQTEDSGLLIGRRGETINSLQHIIGLIIFSQLGEWIRVIVNVGDYREKREESIRSLAFSVAKEVALTKQPVSLPYLVPFERRIVHLTLADHPQIMSISEGEGRDRRIIVKPKE